MYCAYATLNVSVFVVTFVMSTVGLGSESVYPGLGKVRHFYAGVGSDKPLAGQTLGNTQYSVRREQAIAGAFLEMIRNLNEMHGR